MPTFCASRSTVPSVGDLQRPAGSEPEDHAGGYLAGEHVVDGFVDFVELAFDGDDASAACGMKAEDVGGVVASADDRADDRLAVEYGVEDRHVQRAVVGG